MTIGVFRMDQVPAVMFIHLDRIREATSCNTQKQSVSERIPIDVFDLFQIKRLNNTCDFISVSKPAPHFEGTAVVNGEFTQLSLSDYTGKYVVFFFYPLDL